MVSLNLFAAGLSSAMLLVSAAVNNRWVPQAFRSVCLGLACGFALGVIGLLLSRWEATPQSLHYTPNRWLILLITTVVTMRILYGFWQAWNAFQTTSAGESWVAASGAAGSMGAGAAVLGYYVIYWAGLRRKLRKHRASGLR
jgi:cation transport ATPase